MRHPIHALSHHNADSPLSSTPSDTNQGPTAERMQLRSSRRRPRAPDWDSFYKNGVPVPQEVIVIEDSPEPPAKKSGGGHSLNGYQSSLNGLVAGNSNKKRKLDDTASHTTHSSHRAGNGTSSKDYSPTESYRLADREPHPTSSLAQPPATAANGRAGLKRKRATQQSATNGVDPKKLRVDGGSVGSHEEYRGPGRRVTKASDVNVRVVRDVSATHPPPSPPFAS
jgi:dual-specificity kinase